MLDLQFSKPTEEDILFIADNMRDSDVAEVLAAGSASPLRSLTDGVNVSDACVVAKYEGVPMVIFGLRKLTILGDTGVIWMLGTNQSRICRREFTIYTRRVIEEMLAHT